MKDIFKVVKYQIHDFTGGMIIFYAIVLALFILVISSFIGFDVHDDGSVRFGGVGVATVIFLFVSGLNCFKVNFRFLQANNVTRKRFFHANMISLLAVSLFMALVEVILNNVTGLVIPYEGVFEQLYDKVSFVAELVWSFALFGFAAFLGWFITMLYYRCNKLMKTVISIAPPMLFILLLVFNSKMNGMIGHAAADFFGYAFGFSLNNNSYMAALSFWIATAGLAALNYLLIRRAPVKE